jgi:uncharacterized protein YecT (DUF1311 family)
VGELLANALRNAMRLVGPVAILIGLSLTVAHADECMDKASSQADMNACAQRAYQASDAELNKLYRQVEQRLGDNASTRKQLVSTQRAWVAFRDAECKFATSGGGSDSLMTYNLCLEDQTRKRIEAFKAYLSCGDKDDLSCPVPARH